MGALVGGVFGLFGARLVWGALAGLDMSGEHFVHALLVVFLGYMGLVIGATKGEWFEPARMIAAFRDSSRLHQYKILDTSVIIDGRIADICETGFLEGTLVAPQFVLRELQQVADSSDSLKRNRGRRGLDVLQKIQKMAGVTVQIVETDFPEVPSRCASRWSRPRTQSIGPPAPSCTCPTHRSSLAPCRRQLCCGPS